MPVTPQGPAFLADRPTDLRRARPWHRLAYVVERLPEGLGELARELGVPPGGTVLDYGSAESPYRRFFAPGTAWIAADLEGNPDADVQLRPDGSLPLPEASVDAVLSTQVLEHVGDPELHLAECLRVLRPGGRLLLSTHGLMVYHPDPVDLWRWTGAGLEHVVAGAGFEVVRFEGIVGLAASGLQLVQDAFYWRLPRALRGAFAFAMQGLARLADRVERPEARRMNAMVFAVVAEKPRELVGPGLLAACAEVAPEASFVEVGANDGEQHDFLAPHLGRGWTGLMVEPVPYVFARLEGNYAGVPGVTVVNAAIADRTGTLPLFHLVEEPDPPSKGLPDWYDGVGSFSRETVLSHADAIPDVAARLVRSEVRVMTFDDLCAAHDVTRVDVLVVDTEGHDFEVLRHVDLARWRPRLVVYEHFHLSPEDRAACRALLEAAGYATLEEGFDTFCLMPGDGDALDRAWAAARPGVPGVARYELGP